jgi:HEAT repeat protein
MRKLLVIVTLVGASTVAALLVRTSNQHKLRTPVPTADSTEVAALKATSQIDGGEPQAPSSWVIGARHRYSVEAHLEFGRSEAGDAPAAAVTWTGTLEAIVTSHHDGLVEVGYSLTTPRFVVKGGPEQPRSVPQMEQQLAATFAASYDARGRLRQIRTPASLGIEAQPFVRGLLSSMQFTMPPSDKPEWSGEELDIAGEYAATYQRLDQKGRYRRSKQRYLRIAGPRGLNAEGASAQAVGNAVSYFTIGSDGRLAALDMSENGGVRVANQGTQFNSHVRLSVRLLERGKASADAMASRVRDLGPAGLPWLEASAASSGEKADRELVNGADLKTLLAELDRLPPSAMQDRATIQARLSALLRLDARAMDDAVARIRGNDPNADMLAAALGGADTKETQKALVKLAIEPGGDGKAQGRALANLTAIDHPDPSVMGDLKPLLNDPNPDVARAAALAVGATSSRTAELDPGRARAANEDLLASLEHSKTEDDKVWALRALGNAANPEAIPALKETLASPNPVLREAAGEALRAIPGAEAEQLLSTTMLLDPSPDVRRGVVFAARYHKGEGLLNPLGIVCRDDHDESVRGVAIETLGRMAQSNDTALAQLQWSAEHDPSERNRRAARELVEGALANEGG